MNAENAIQSFWMAYWDIARRYHRYQVDGLEILEEYQPALIVGYHGRPLAIDLCILSTVLAKRLGYLPHCFLHRDLLRIPHIDKLIDGLGFLTHDDEKVAKAVERKEHIMVPPGGAYEGMRSYHDNYRVEWPDSGYIKLAINHQLPIIPVAAAGADETYIGLLDGEEIVRRLGLSRSWAWGPWTGIGLLGLYPFSPPFPVQLYQVIGEPISTSDVEIDDEDGIAYLHDQVTSKVQELLEFALQKKAASKNS